MQQAQCAFCFSTNVRIVASEQNKDLMVVRCNQCGRTSELDVENVNTTLNDPRMGPPNA